MRCRLEWCVRHDLLISCGLFTQNWHATRHKRTLNATRAADDSTNWTNSNALTDRRSKSSFRKMKKSQSQFNAPTCTHFRSTELVVPQNIMLRRRRLSRRSSAKALAALPGCNSTSSIKQLSPCSASDRVLWPWPDTSTFCSLGGRGVSIEFFLKEMSEELPTVRPLANESSVFRGRLMQFWLRSHSDDASRNSLKHPPLGSESSKNRRTNPGCPTGMPKIFTTWASGNVVSPVHTTDQELHTNRSTPPRLCSSSRKLEALHHACTLSKKSRQRHIMRTANNCTTSRHIGPACDFGHPRNPLPPQLFDCGPQPIHLLGCSCSICWELCRHLRPLCRLQLRHTGTESGNLVFWRLLGSAIVVDGCAAASSRRDCNRANPCSSSASMVLLRDSAW